MKEQIEEILRSKIVVDNPGGVKFFVEAMEVFIKQKQRAAAENGWHSGFETGQQFAGGEPVSKQALTEHLKQYE